MLDVDNTVRQLIYEGTMTQLHAYLDEMEFNSFRAAAIAKVTSGVTIVDEVLRVLPHSSLHRRPRRSKINPLNGSHGQTFSEKRAIASRT